MPGSPYRSEDGAIDAVRIAREHGIPFLGTCGGFQHAMLEFARNVCGRPDARTRENIRDAEDVLIIPLACSLAGHEDAVQVTPGLASWSCWGRSGRRALPLLVRSRQSLIDCCRARNALHGHDDAAPSGSPSCPTTRSSSPPCSSRNWPATAPVRTRSSGFRSGGRR